MFTREEKKITIWFDVEDEIIVKRLIHEQVGTVTISDIIEDMSSVLDWYKTLMSMLQKVRSGWYVELDRDELNVLASLLSKAYNSDTETEKEAIKKISDAIALVW